MELEKLFNPSSIAIVGASQEAGKVGNAIAKNILELGYQGKVFLVNPKYQKLFGQKCYSKLEDIEDAIDLAIIVIPVKFVLETIKNASEKVKNFVVISAGFSEIGEEGAQREKEIIKLIAEKNLNILGPNCLGFIIPKLKLNASFAGGIPKQGNISFVSQSGAL
ncbi:MAG: CoA-binding protein, partial [bacterium]|nr:CoA-binding protein [bacterium]